MTPLKNLFFNMMAGLILVIGLAFPLSAQTSEQARSYYDSWLRTAERAEDVIDTSRASNIALEQLRKDLTDYRQTFQTKRSENGDRIQTLQGQLDALGPAPAEGESEPEDIALLREALTKQLNQLRVPRIVAEEAYSRADGLINEIDKIVRDRLTRRLLERGPSPLNPEHWQQALRDMGVQHSDAQDYRNSVREKRRAYGLTGTGGTKAFHYRQAHWRYYKELGREVFVRGYFAGRHKPEVNVIR